ncbi:chemotaxis protein CheA [Rhizobium beringeri]
MSTLDPVAVFRTEAAECLEAIEGGLLDLTHQLDNKGSRRRRVPRAPTLKGSGAMFGFEALAAFTHHCETAFDRVRKGEVAATSELVAAVLAAQDHMRALVDQPDADYGDTGHKLLAQLQAAVGGKQAAAAAAPAAVPTTAAGREAPAKKKNSWRIRFQPARQFDGQRHQPARPAGRAARSRRMQRARQYLGHSALDELAPTELHISWDVTLTSEQDRSAIDDVFIFVLDDMELSVEEISGTAAATAAPVEEKAAAAPVAATSAAAVPEFRPVEAVPAKREVPAAVSQAKAAENVRVPAERLDELMDRVGELVIAQSRLSQLASASAEIALRSVSEEIERLSGELRDTMMVLRMVPVATLFSRFRRLVHDLARETGKVIELVTEGESTEVDKTVIERLADPLVHLVRNSIDHGLETPADRLASGKTEAGTVTLLARQAGGEVIISIKDDGRGINRERVRAKAESSGLIHPGQPLSDPSCCS